MYRQHTCIRDFQLWWQSDHKKWLRRMRAQWQSPGRYLPLFLWEQKFGFRTLYSENVLGRIAQASCRCYLAITAKLRWFHKTDGRTQCCQKKWLREIHDLSRLGILIAKLMRLICSATNKLSQCNTGHRGCLTAHHREGVWVSPILKKRQLVIMQSSDM